MREWKHDDIAEHPVKRTNNFLGGLLSRFGSLVGQTHQGRRDLYDVFGYPRYVSSELLYGTYRRQDIANRIVRAFPQATWRECPVIRDEAGAHSNDKEEGYSPFVEAIEDLFDRMRVIQALERADRLASIGRFGILVLGFRDGQPLDQPLAEGNFPLLYLQPYGDPHVAVERWDEDPTSPRFGLPEYYTVTAGQTAESGERQSPMRSFRVHWSRTIHIAEFLEEDNVYGMPRLLPVFNRLIDLEKVVGGGAETFWLNADRGIAFWADKEAALTDDDIARMKEEARKFRDRWEKTLVGSGMTAQVLGSDTPDPGPNVDRLLDLISGATGIPKRILIGSERGELSSAQDENNWSARIDERRKNFATPAILQPLITILIRTGNLPKPEGAWWVEWPEHDNIGPVEKSTVASNQTKALADYANSPGAQFIVPPAEFREKILGLSAESEYDLPEELADIDPNDLLGLGDEEGEGDPSPPDEGDERLEDEAA